MLSRIKGFFSRIWDWVRERFAGAKRIAGKAVRLVEAEWEAATPAGRFMAIVLAGMAAYLVVANHHFYINMVVAAAYLGLASLYALVVALGPVTMVLASLWMLEIHRQGGVEA